MKLAKSLLLSSAVGLTAVASAQAADLPFRKAAPVEYVRVCDFTGAGYFYIPGTDTCLKVGGYVRTEYTYISPSTAYFPQLGSAGPGGAIVAGGTRIPGRLRDASGFFARGRLEADARTQTAYGTLRTFVRFELTRTGGNYSGSASSQQSFANQNGSGANVDKAFIQFAGFTVGRAQSFFDFYADNYNFEGIANSDQSTQMFAYTATLGGGFSVTGSVEDPTVRRNGIGNSGDLITTGSSSSVSSVGSVGYGSVVIPDFVGVVRYDQAWGAVQLSAAYHEVKADTFDTAGVNAGEITRDGFAVQGGVQIKLPMLAAGDDLWLEGAYQEGAYLYMDSAGTLNSGFNALLLGGFQHQDRDAYIYTNAAGASSLSLSKGFSVMGALHHYFTPNFSDVLFGSYEEVSYGNRAKSTDWRLGGIGDASEFRIGNQFIWTPVNNLSIGIEGIYAKIDQDIAGGAAAQAAFAALNVKKNPDSFEGRIRVERDF
ncbi:porin [Lichenihabitans sp. Uapishka_5]|uniref:porin n=1 Tax=Lichenihabitans sp. Uapishka_5 TaxID=3037302 RepID=UPI0029E7E9A6|nr:porin [Lichenihabitans sp. Uapishka_5]MDX7952459.1 porin [Lichenihabitans sp. Uapishka_5]